MCYSNTISSVEHDKINNLDNVIWQNYRTFFIAVTQYLETIVFEYIDDLS